MQRFFSINNDTLSEAESDAETAPDSWCKTLAHAAGWLNPFNLIRNGSNRIFITSLTLMQYVTNAAAEQCFQVFSHNHPLAPAFYGNLNCRDKSNPPGLEESCIASILDDNAYRATAVACGEITNVELVSFPLGRGAFGGSRCTLDISYTTSNDDYNYASREARLLSYFPYNKVDMKVQSGWGTEYDYQVRNNLVIAGICVGAAALAATALYFGYRAFNRWSQANHYMIWRRVARKEKGLTQALADNDAALMHEIHDMAAASNVNLPKDIMYHILQNTRGYHDDDYRNRYHESLTDDPSPVGFVATPANGRKAAFLRFCDTMARENARRKEFHACWNEMRALDQQQLRDNSLLEVDGDNKEDVELLSDQVPDEAAYRPVYI